MTIVNDLFFAGVAFLILFLTLGMGLLCWNFFWRVDRGRGDKINLIQTQNADILTQIEGLRADLVRKKLIHEKPPVWVDRKTPADF